MKSGSSYISRVLRNYFGIDELLSFPRQIDFNAEHNFTPWLVAATRGRSFCFNFHMQPYPSNMEVVAQEGVALRGLWRNLGDMVVSWDDHVVGDNEGGITFCVLDQERFKAMPAHARFTFLIDSVVPWYLNFYLRWHRAGLVLYPYEQMLLDRYGFFVELLTPLLTHPPIESLLNAALSGGARSSDRFNVGRVGRSTDKLDDANKRQLENKILNHPDSDQLEILLWELPWDVPALQPHGPLDGQVVKPEGEEQPYFVSRGIAYPIGRASWIGGRSGGRRTPRAVAADALADYPRGATLL